MNPTVGQVMQVISAAPDLPGQEIHRVQRVPLPTALSCFVQRRDRYVDAAAYARIAAPNWSPPGPSEEVAPAAAKRRLVLRDRGAHNR